VFSAKIQMHFTKVFQILAYFQKSQAWRRRCPATGVILSRLHGTSHGWITRLFSLVHLRPPV